MKPSRIKLITSFKRRFQNQTFFNNKHTPFKQKLTDTFFQNPPRLVLVSFAVVIMLGTILLALPQATSTPEPLSFIDALFTSTSATCVTGLIVAQTGTKFSLFGQIVILVLIQVGGLGIMTLSTFFVYVISGRLGFQEREVLIDTLSQHPKTELTRLLKTVFLFTVLLEGVGWIFLTLRFVHDFPVGEAMYLGLFHAISAFCNAGFSLFADSFVQYQNDPVINLVIGILIILGGLGFLVVYDLFRNRKVLIQKKFSSLSFHSKLVLLSSSLLIVTGFVLFFTLEWNNSLHDLPLYGKIFASFFQSVSARTAGFNTISFESISIPTLFMLIILMFIGASPGSCGGGVKTTTMTLVIASIMGRLRMREDVNLLYRRIPEATLSRVISIIFFSITIIILFTFLLLVVEVPQNVNPDPKGRFMEIFFEVISAFGTVGLSTGITPDLSNSGKILITILMFVGRLGPLTLALAIQGKIMAPKFKYLKEDVMVG